MLKKWLAGICLIGLAVYMCWTFYENYTKKEEVGIEEGQKAPDFSLKALSGEETSLSDYKGKKVLLNFWATWCHPCRKEMPAMEELQKEHSEIAVVAVNFTSAEKGEKTVKQFADSLHLTFPILIDKSGINADYSVLTYPTTYILDEKGVIQQIYAGTMTKKQMKQKLGLD
ncbi:redoxin domain-containing protein [Bacillus atrophaeus]|uniref:redoxin domain-containing protein n=1 Tax=Bacillus atrophaeus TaxID=1452 RepID=UPI002280F2E9|nr:redoxin domain-containing protein [Bacillus atrophaeus]MCY7945454.1 redoxin domain-containing protein [Bacillus atrophaeus]MCY8098437.1 redoxin domain-containing protein [Bacillus atrophaeus]MCY9167948.1 redoxin domain-containing protein [Bacillus atrophaeus]MEC0741889.1 redoxin domain-containing protein [Bacillus atrophaeus]MEC0744797.1 redoxin domain-containing protein [Bacillus atrophaeus]